MLDVDLDRTRRSEPAPVAATAPPGLPPRKR